MAAATAMAVVGIGMSVASMFGSSSAAKKEAALEKQKFADEQKIQQQKQQAMELDAQRRTLESIRGAQRARAVALNNAVAQGAGQGSGLQGGYGQITGQANTNLLGINQNLTIGRNISSLNQDISGLNMQEAGVKAEEQMWSGLGSLGKSFTGASSLPMFG